MASQPVDDRPVSTVEREAEIGRISRQVERLSQTMSWGRVQNDRWDQYCQFIFRLRTIEQVRTRVEHSILPPEIADERAAFEAYALRRWYCFWCSRIAELLFLEHPNVAPGPPRDHEVDFTVGDLPFDLKTTELPRAFSGRTDDVDARPEFLASWLYDHQSRERRYDGANRLFLVLIDREDPEDAWRLRGDVAALRASIDRFLAAPRYAQLWIPDAENHTHRILTAIIPVHERPNGKQLPLQWSAEPAAPAPKLTRVAEAPPEIYQPELPLGIDPLEGML